MDPDNLCDFAIGDDREFAQRKNPVFRNRLTLHVSGPKLASGHSEIAGFNASRLDLNRLATWSRMVNVFKLRHECCLLE